MGFDVSNLFLFSIVFFIFGSVCVLSTIFTFRLDIYLKLEDRLNLEILSTPVFSPLEININFFDVWAKEHNKIIGSFLVIISLVDMQLFFSIINKI